MAGPARPTVAALLATVAAAAAGLMLHPAAASAQAENPTGPREPVPCEVAMVVGCVATVEGNDGQVAVTLQITEDGGEPAGSGEPDEAGAGVGAAGSAAAQIGEAGEDGDRPVRSGVDPWERGGLQSNFGTGSIPISHYQIGADTSGFLGVPDPLDSFVASQTNWAFTTSTFLVLLATNALDWAFEFPLAGDLVGEAGVLAQDYTVDFFGFGLATSVYSLALTVTMVVAGFKAVTKGVIAAGSEVLVAFAAYVVLIVLTLTSGFGNAGLTVARISSDLSASIASFASGQDRQQECAAALSAEAVDLAGAEAATDGTAGAGAAAPSAAAGSSACSFGFALQRSLVELPYQNLQWGQVLDGVAGKEQCAAINLELLAEGPWGNDDEPRDRMRAVAACEENADFNHQATYIRLGIASANTLAAAIVTLLVLVVSAMLLWQQLKLLFLTVTMPHALVFAILPGRSRTLAWQWVEHLVGVVIRTVILSLGLVVWLSLFSLIVYEQLTLRGIFLSLFASTAMAISGFYGLYRMSGLTGRINPAAVGRTGSRSGGPAGGRDEHRERDVGTRLLVEGARTTLRSVRRSAPRTRSDDRGRPGAGLRTGSDDGPNRHRPRIGGGPGDRPGGGAAAPAPDGPPLPTGAGR